MSDNNDFLEVDSEQESVLLVDDNPINLKILYKTLENSGYQLLTAENGTDALSLARSKRPSLILLDIMMPDMDGYEVCEQLKADDETHSIAVIFLSALEDTSAKVKGFSVGGVDYISKPFQPDEIVARVRNHMKIHRLETELARRNFELESENNQILNSVSEGIIGLNQQGRVTMLNPAATVITGWSAGDVLGEQLTKIGLFDTDSSDAVQEHQTLAYRSYQMGVPAQADMEMICRRDGKKIPVAISCTPRSEGGAVMVIRDISEWVQSEENLRIAREEAESQRQNMAHMERLSTSGEMAAGIAHEVNQPLTAVTNYARVAKRLLESETTDVDKLVELMNKLDTQAVRASEVIQRLRSYVKKPDAGITAVSPSDMIKDVVDLAEVDSRINDIPVHFEAPTDLPQVSVDLVQIQQVALNLIRNAMEAMVDVEDRDQGVLVTASQEGNYVMFRIIDSGAGIDQAIADELFNPFFTTKAKGMGVGLSICQSIIQAHGGDIGFEPNPGGGTIFFFKLPAS